MKTCSGCHNFYSLPLFMPFPRPISARGVKFMAHHGISWSTFIAISNFWNLLDIHSFPIAFLVSNVYKLNINLEVLLLSRGQDSKNWEKTHKIVEALGKFIVCNDCQSGEPQEKLRLGENDFLSINIGDRSCNLDRAVDLNFLEIHKLRFFLLKKVLLVDDCK